MKRISKKDRIDIYRLHLSNTSTFMLSKIFKLPAWKVDEIITEFKREERSDGPKTTEAT